MDPVLAKFAEYGPLVLAFGFLLWQQNERWKADQANMKEERSAMRKEREERDEAMRRERADYSVRVEEFTRVTAQATVAIQQATEAIHRSNEINEQLQEQLVAEKRRAR